MANLTEEEKQLLTAAKKLRRIVKADVEKTANPALLALVEAIGPALARFGPQLMQMVRSIPPQAWGQIAQNIIGMLGHAAESASKAASTDAKTRAARTAAAVEKTLTKAGVKNAKAVSQKVVLASIQAVADHRKKANPKLTKALAMITKAQTEIALLREFV